MGMIALRFSIS